MAPALSETPERARVRVPAFSVFLAFLRLGLTSFGGPIAHLGYFRRELVERRRWLSEPNYADLVALCQFLPGPASSQTGFAIGLRMAGAMGGLAAFLGFTLPSALLMLAAAWGLREIDPRFLPPIVHGLNLVAVAVVAQAVVQMARASLKSLSAWTLAALSLAFALYAGAGSAPIIIAAAAFAGFVTPPGPRAEPATKSPKLNFRPSLVLLLVALAPLALLPVLRQITEAPALVTADSFYRTGSLVFGGGHVVLPLLEAETVGRISHDDFLAGYGAAQALPGPLFSFAACAGALAAPNPPDLVLGLIALLSIFAPGLLLVAAADPVWLSLRNQPRARSLASFAAASVLGVLAAAWWRLVVENAILSPWDIALSALGFLALLHPRTPVLAVLIPLTALGAAAFTWT